MAKNTLSHTTWECKCHIVFAPKFRRQIIYGKLKADIAHIISTLCKRKGVEIIQAEACADHIHMLVRIPPNISVADFMGYLKGKSALMIFDRHANLKYKYGNRKFWCRGYYVGIVVLCNERKYLIPLSHPVSKHEHMKREQILIKSTIRKENLLGY